MSRFDYVQYDAEAKALQIKAKYIVENVEIFIAAVGDARGPYGRPLSLALTKLEECYAWIGKAIRDRQIYLNGSAPLQEERGNS